MGPVELRSAPATRDEVLRAAARLGLSLDEDGVEGARLALDQVLAWAGSLPAAPSPAPAEPLAAG
ncbi:hypothetical protein L6R53_28005 [Myxococcota bacterium]|nr:hypothetical protein [Myxococcota bacterium]